MVLFHCSSRTSLLSQLPARSKKHQILVMSRHCAMMFPSGGLLGSTLQLPMTNPPIPGGITGRPLHNGGD